MSLLHRLIGQREMLRSQPQPQKLRQGAKEATLGSAASFSVAAALATGIGLACRFQGLEIILVAGSLTGPLHREKVLQRADAHNHSCNVDFNCIGA